MKFMSNMSHRRELGGMGGGGHDMVGMGTTGGHGGGGHGDATAEEMALLVMQFSPLTQ
jgi:hypothetical protein